MASRLLVVAEADTLLRALRYHFTNAGDTVDAASDNEAALRLLATGVPDVVICEDAPPGADALQLVKQLRASPLTKRARILVLSYSPADAKARAVLAAGADECIKRDTPIPEIGDRVSRLIAESKGGSPPRTAAANTITVVGARGGSGKTMLATNLGVLLAQRPGETAVVVDLNLEFGTVAMMLDLRPEYSLREIADASLNDVGDAEFDSLILRHSTGLRVVPGVAQPGDSELIPSAALPLILERLRRLYDHVIIDSRPSFREALLDLWDQSDTLLVTCPPEVISVLLTRSLLDAFATVNINPAKILLVLNQVAPKARLNPGQVEKGLGHPAYRIPYGGDELYRAIDVGKSIVVERPNDSATQALRKLADLLVQRRMATTEVSAQAS